MEITADHVKELATLFGENVLVIQPGTACLWVIATGNKHYEGASTVWATGLQVADMIDDADWNEDAELTDAAADRIAKELTERPRREAIESAKGLENPDGFSAGVMLQMNDTTTAPSCEMYAGKKHDDAPPPAVARVALMWTTSDGTPMVSEKELCRSCYAEKVREMVDKGGVIHLLKSH